MQVLYVTILLIYGLVLGIVSFVVSDDSMPASMLVMWTSPHLITRYRYLYPKTVMWLQEIKRYLTHRIKGFNINKSDL